MWTKRILVLLLSLFFFRQQIPAQIRIDSGLIAFFPMDGNVLDHSSNNFFAHINGWIEFKPDRYENKRKAFLFDGATNFLTVKIGLYDSLSVAMWINPFEVNDPLNNIRATIFDYGEKAFYANLDGISGVSPNLNPDWSKIRLYTDSSGAIKADRQLNEYFFWNHVYLEAGSSHNNPRIYLNGRMVGQTAGKKNKLFPKDSTIFVGRLSRDYEPDDYYVGYMDEVRIYKRFLNEEEIRYLASDYPNSVSHNQRKRGILLFPNPARNNILVTGDLPQKYILRLYDTRGNLHIQQYNNPLVPIHGLPGGVYLIQIKDILKDSVSIHKFIKM